MKIIKPELEKPPLAIQIDKEEVECILNDLVMFDDNEGACAATRRLMSHLRTYIEYK